MPHCKSKEIIILNDERKQLRIQDISLCFNYCDIAGADAIKRSHNRLLEISTSTAKQDLPLVKALGKVIVCAGSPGVQGHRFGFKMLKTHYGHPGLIALIVFSAFSCHITKLYLTTIAKGWWADANYDSNTYDRIRMSNSVLAKSAITTSRIIVSDESGYFHLAASKPFLISKPILWAASSFSAGYYGSNNYLSYPNCTLRNNLPGFTGTTQKTCYIVGRLNGEMFTPTSTLFTTDVPDEVDGLVYIALGIMVSAYGIYLYPEHPMFSFVGDSFKNLNQVAFEAPAELETKLAEVHAQISTTADSIRQEVQATYAPATDMAAIRQQMTTLSEQTEANFTWTVSQYGTLASEVQGAKEATEEQMRLIQTYMTFGEDGLVIGKSGNPFTFRVVNDRLAFYMNNTEVAYLSNNKLYVTQAEILTRLQVGKFAFEPQTNGNLSLIYTG